MSEIKNIVEALLLSSGEPLSADRIHKIINSKKSCTKADILETIDELNIEYNEKEIEVTRVASGFRIQAKSSINDFLNIIYAEKTPRYSRALMETLSIIAYKQPVTRGDIESIRGVSVSSSIMRTLTDRNWIKIVGYKDVPGKPAMFSTTNEFLDYFGLEKLTELPDLPDIKEPENLNLDLEPETLNEVTAVSSDQLN
ncbi:MAG: SMC-Scp complex subunit ScpB [Gammaproteobacteria bacterium]|jgi:segregation and condensation protein B|nr:SMC-Scp complex subunit ScpB [Gammaproteobacteria bacterium]MBQ08234.1 SMC-Scp complex subunit ScpB [Gammaproteobacteria bacterium]MDP6147429.1 SMC-Scp complex subunit ScpB [Gammaproteobacteria bacterium]HJL79707.1 SMC-Scp complex subunit ScpB [Gammaproteobacteria bacterium]HJM09157.1 SMC-Scp complex subunit ScpB [Gammaproteobacteria bacterium]|tara:strand:- start:17195 stop:17788 length:594 start_codon:yes stop_codon:yes gene_type:complete